MLFGAPSLTFSMFYCKIAPYCTFITPDLMGRGIMDNPGNINPMKLINKMNALSTPVLEMPLPEKIVERLAAFISDASFGKIASSDVKIADVLHSAFDLEDMVDLNGIIKGRLFTPRQCDAITGCLVRVYKINYCIERRLFLAPHRGIESFIARTDIPNKARYAILRDLQNYNGKISDLLISKNDFRHLPGVGSTTTTCVMLLCEQDGVNFWQYFKDN